MSDRVIGFAIGLIVVIIVIVLVNQEGKRIKQDMAELDAAEKERELHYFNFEHLLDAIEWVESRGDANAIGQDGEVGAYQLKEIYVDDYCRIVQTDFCKVFSDGDIRLDKELSRDITAVVTNHYAMNDHPELPPHSAISLQKAARSHNSPANRNNSKTDAYWHRIKARMEEVHPDYLWKE